MPSPQVLSNRTEYTDFLVIPRTGRQTWLAKRVQQELKALFPGVSFLAFNLVKHDVSRKMASPQCFSEWGYGNFLILRRIDLKSEVLDTRTYLQSAFCTVLFHRVKFMALSSYFSHRESKTSHLLKQEVGLKLLCFLRVGYTALS